ncbi:MAG: hypothetical protein BMS9Abin18_1157 [Zetaproteobacteria bacterium]|nr:MAG: hypothetical protein BMS9Abin18_1157 [Zetaproteobacteria bacterium]
MKYLMPMTYGVILFLSGCGQHDDALHATQMQRLQLMMVHAADMAVQGSDQIIAEHTGQGRNLLSQSADVLRRAMSGSEMNAMHQGGAGLSPIMRKTHNLGDAMFNLLELMMKSSTEQARARCRLNQSLAMAAEGTELVLSGHLSTEDDLGKFMIEQGRQLQASANGVLTTHPLDNTSYAKAIEQVVEQMNAL